MEEQLTQWMISRLPSFVIVGLTALALIIFMVWWSAKIWHRLNSRPCEEHHDIMKSLAKKEEKISSSLAKLEGKMDIMIKALPTLLTGERNYGIGESVLSEKKSPRSLNKNGHKVYELFECEAFIKENGEWIITEMAKLTPATRLDVENVSFAVLRMLSADSRFNGLKSVIYNSPKIKFTDAQSNEVEGAVTLDDVLFVMSLALRDRYISLHPELM